MGAESESNDDACAVGLGCALEAFTEVEEVKDLINRLRFLTRSTTEYENVHQRFVIVLDRYQEQPHLIDPHLPSILSILVDNILKPESLDHVHSSCSFAAHLVKVRGYKVIVRQLPHEVHHVEPVIGILEEQDAKSSQDWETKYFLLIWMSILVLIPFHMTRFDGSVGARRPLMDRIMSICKRYLACSNKCKDAASFLTAKFLTRPEAVTSHLPEFLDWSLQIISSKSTTPASDIEKLGALGALACVYKHAKRSDLQSQSRVVLRVIIDSDLKNHQNILVRKMAVKLVQRIGLVFLPAKVASWRYQRGNRSLALLISNTSDPSPVPPPSADNDDEEGDYEVPDDIEDIIDELLTGLRSSETIIRWSAAKGIGRVTSRLPKELADDVVQSLLELFSLRETDGAWQGGCLALAELARRGLLLPQKLPEVVKVVAKALVFDEKRGCYSVGSHVRDAACYVCWAFARAYEPNVMRPQVECIAACLLIVAVFDREVNCRRAASAAFQENVGRLGNFPHGIDILTKTDYHSVGSRSNAYLDLSVYVGQYREYTEPLIRHLVEKKVGHWDPHVRELAAQALNRLSKVASALLSESVMPQLLKNLETFEDLYLKHGSILSVGELTLGLSNYAQNNGQTLLDIFDEKILNQIKHIVILLEQKMALRGTGGELLRGSVTSYIQNLSEAHFPCHNDDVVLDIWKMVLDDNLSSPDPTVQEKAVQAIPAFIGEYFKDVEAEKIDQLISHYLSKLDTSELHRRGFAQAIGNLPDFVLRGRLNIILPELINRTKIAGPETEKWAEGRRDSVKAINSIVKSLGVLKSSDINNTICSSNLTQIMTCYIDCLDDYTTDRRGDIGAWVREAAMTGILQLIQEVVSTDVEMIPAVWIQQVMPKLAQQAVEKIDRTRGHAGLVFALILFSKTEKVPFIPNHEEIMQLFPDEAKRNIEKFDWSVESKTFPIFSKLVRFPSYRDRVTLGLVVSIGGLTERLVKFAGESLYSELRIMSSSELEQFAQSLLVLFEKNHKVDRVILPLFKFLDQLLTSGYFDSVLNDTNSTFSMDLFNLLKKEIAKSGDPNKLLSCGDVMCALLQSADVNTLTKCLVQLSIFLCHKFPRVRKQTATKLFEAILTYADREICSDENLDDVNAILSDTNWSEASVEDLRPIRNKLCELLKVEPPVVVKKPV